MIGARRYHYDARATAGQQFAFDYDNIGNRRRAWHGGDTHGSNLRTIGYAVNNLNQYTRITNSGHLNVLGAALATNAVWVNGQLAQRQGEYFRAELGLGNGNGPAWTNVAVASGGRTNGGGVLMPPLEQELVYDADGNLVFDGIWSYQWDAENRLVAMTMTDVSGIPDAQRKRLEFAYDHLNRRVAKVVWSWNGSAFANPVTNRYVYDGWNVLAVLDSGSSVLQSFVWGQDLSGTMDGAGGVGGLLLFQSYSNSCLLTSSFCAYDGNGNITALINAADKNVAARYEYSPYGQLLRATGPLAVANPFRWSTKFWDEESGLVYYGYRYYSPMTGRWISRDPVETLAGPNLYAFLENKMLQAVDRDGRLFWFLAAIGVSGVLGAAFNPDDPWLGFLTGAASAAVGYGAGGLVAVLARGGVIGATLGGTGSNLVSTYSSFVMQHYATAKESIWTLDTKQAMVLDAAGAGTFLLGAFVGGRLAAARGGDVDEQVLELTLAIASSVGVGAANAFAEGAYQSAQGAKKVVNGYLDRLDETDE